MLFYVLILSGLQPQLESVKKMSFAKRIELLIGNDTERGFAQKAGVSPTAVHQWKHGKAMPGLESLLSIASACNVDIRWLAAGEGPMRPGGISNGCPEMVFEVWRACEDFLAQEGIKVRDMAKFRELVKAICTLVAKQQTSGDKVVDLTQYRDFIRLVG